MKIASATIELSASHDKQQSHQIRESLRIGQDRMRAIGDAGPRLGRPQVNISDAGKSAQSAEASAIESGMDAVENDPMLLLIRTVVAMLTGEEVKVFDRKSLGDNTPAAVPDLGQAAATTGVAASPASMPSLEYTRHEIFSESEHTAFAASGKVSTADGKEIEFVVSLDMARSYHEESNVGIRFGEAREQKDPLVINFGGQAAQLSSQRFRFDLDADGKKESINFVAGGSGFLVFDRNDDGKINDGSELFGAKTGDGFAELAALDTDRNGWIDENDTTYAQLQVWTKDSGGRDQLSSLKQSDVGAISLHKVATPFDLKDTENTQLGQIRTTGIYLRENGGVSTVQQIDLTV